MNNSIDANKKKKRRLHIIIALLFLIVLPLPRFTCFTDCTWYITSLVHLDTLLFFLSALVNMFLNPKILLPSLGNLAIHIGVGWYLYTLIQKVLSNTSSRIRAYATLLFGLLFITAAVNLIAYIVL